MKNIGLKSKAKNKFSKNILTFNVYIYIKIYFFYNHHKNKIKKVDFFKFVTDC